MECEQTNMELELEWEEGTFLFDEEDLKLCPGDSQAERAQALLDHLDLLIKSQEPLDNWAEEKSVLPLLDDLNGLVPNTWSWGGGAADSGEAGSSPEQHTPVWTASPQQTTSWNSTNTIIQEFAQLLHNTLATPTTPPNDAASVPVTQSGGCESELDDLVGSLVGATGSPSGSASESSGWSSPEQQGTWAPSPVWSSVASDSPSAPAHWSDVASPSQSSDEATSGTESSDLEWNLTKVGSKKRSVTSTEEKKQRKKEQNKNAATRYRMKKKAEHEVILEEEQRLLTINSTLKEQTTEIQREIKYLKSLMRDVCKAKGLIK